MKSAISNALRIVALGWLVFLVAYALGVLTYKYDTWPVTHIREVVRFVVGHEEESTSLWQKIQNDTGILPVRHLVNSAAKAYEYSAYRPLDGLPLKSRRQPPLVYMGREAPRGYRVLHGVFDFDTNLHGAVLLGPDGEMQHYWTITQNDVPWTHSPDSNVFPHGFEITRNGSIIVAYDGGNSLTKYDYCGRVEWQLEGKFHHSIDFYDQNAFWVWGDGKVDDKLYGKQISHIDGSIRHSFAIRDIIEANPEIDILGIRQIDRGEDFLWAHDPFHQNDIDPLPKELAQYYPQFQAGDLLVSMRSINLVFILNPENLRIKWWRQGLARRPHDPDWNAHGTITIFNNNMHRKYSSIVEVNPQNMESHTLIDGTKYNFYTWARGKHQLLPGGNVLITSTQQGRVFEVAPNGTVTFDFHNIYDEESRALVISEALFLPLDYFLELPKCDG